MQQRLTDYSALLQPLTVHLDPQDRFPRVEGALNARAFATAALFPRVDVDLLRISGPERGKFLQGLLTADVAKLAQGQGAGAALLDIKGKMQCDMRLYQRSDDFLIELPWGKGAQIAALLDRYLIRMKAKIHEESSDWFCWLVAGPLAIDVLRGFMGEALPDAVWSGAEGVIGGSPASVVASDWLGRAAAGTFHVWARRQGWEDVWRALQAAVVMMGGGVVGTATFESERLRAAVPRFGVDIDEDTIPLEAKLEHLISFKKGCYLGQEIIARIDSRGAVARHLVKLRAHGPIKQGDTLRAADKVLGEITTAGEVDGAVLALGWTRRGFEAPSTELTTGDGVRVEVIAT